MDTNTENKSGRSYLIELQPVPGREDAAYRDGVLDLRYPGESNALVSEKKLTQLIQDQYLVLPGKPLQKGAGFSFRMVRTDSLSDREIEQIIEDGTINSSSQIDGFHPRKQRIEELIQYRITKRALKKAGFKEVESGEGKLAAIMFTDIVEYSSLMGEEEQKALQLLERNRALHDSVVRQFKGILHKELGDGFLASFPSTGNAVKCAIEIQMRLKDDPDLRLRIGIHLGEALFRHGDILGESVNIANRIMPFAAEGGICVSGEVNAQIHNKPDMNAIFLRSEILKGVKTPIELYAISTQGLPVPA